MDGRGAEVYIRRERCRILPEKWKRFDGGPFHASDRPWMTLTRNFAATLKLRSYFSSPPAYHLTNQPLQQPPPPHWVVVTSRHESPPPPPLLTWLCFSFYQVASFPCIASPISLSRLGSTKGIPRFGLLYPLKRFSRTLMKKASPSPWGSRYYSYNILLPSWPLHSSTPSFEFCLFSSINIISTLSHLSSVCSGQSAEKI